MALASGASLAASSSFRQSCIWKPAPIRAAGFAGGSPTPKRNGFSIPMALMQLRVSALSPPASSDTKAICRLMAVSRLKHSNGRSAVPWRNGGEGETLDGVEDSRPDSVAHTSDLLLRKVSHKFTPRWWSG